MQVLCKLAEQPGEVFTRAELLDSVWHGVTVGEEALTRSVSELRKAFDDDPKKPAVIETIYKTGYRLLAPVETEAVATKEKTSEQRFLSLKVPGTGPIAAIFAVTLCVVGITTALLTNTSSQEKSDAYTDFRLSPLTSLPGEELSPALSPDGKTVVFSWREPGARHTSLISQKVETGERTVLFADEGALYYSPAWSPNGQSIAFVRKDEAKCEVLRYDVRSKRVDNLYPCTSRRPKLAWRPDGNAIAISDREKRGAPYSIFEISLVGDSTKKLTNPPMHIVGDRQVAYSFDGDTIAFLRVKATGISDIYRKSLNTNETARITFDDTKIGGLAWLNSAGELAFTSNRRGEWDLWKIDEKGLDISMLSVGAEAHGFSYSTRPQQIVFEQRSVDTNLWTVDLENPEALPSMFASSTRWDDDPSISYGGDKVVFVSDRSGAPEIWVADIETEEVERLTFFDGGLILRPRWSPDDKNIVFNARIDGNADIYSINLETRSVSRITDHLAIDAMPQWSNDGSSIYYTSNRNGEWQVWRTAEGGGDEQQVTKKGGIAPSQSAALNGVIHERPGIDGLWLHNDTSVEPIEVVNAFKTIAPGRWVVQNGSIFYLRMEEDESILWRFDLLSKENIRLKLPHSFREGEVATITFTMSPDNKTLIYSTIDARSSDLQLLELNPAPSNDTLIAKNQSKSLFR